MKKTKKNFVEKIGEILGNKMLAHDIYKSVSSALNSPLHHNQGAKTVEEVFEQSLNAAIRDIEIHPRGKLFKRLIEFGPLNPGEQELPSPENISTLTDEECGSCVEFIYSHMINRFKGELAELLALEPCLNLIKINVTVEEFQNLEFYWGESIKERRRIKTTNEGEFIWGGFTKGADGLLINFEIKKLDPQLGNVIAVIEVKSMSLPHNKIYKQISKHIDRFAGGIRLNENEIGATNVGAQLKHDPKEQSILRIMVEPSKWKLSREWKINKERNSIEFPAISNPKEIQYIELKEDFWKITLGWSQEALSQAAFNMTFWYMSQVGKHIFKDRPLPKEWNYMTHEEAGYNSIKMMLYYILLRNISSRQIRLATILYNVYSFGYPLGIDSKEMLWVEDFETG